MKTVFLPKSTLSFAGLLWIYIFVSLSFFQNHSSVIGELDHGSSTTLNKKELSLSESVQTFKEKYIYVQNVGDILTLDSDFTFFCATHTARSLMYPTIKTIIANSHLHLKNSPITIRMTSPVLLV